MNVEFGFGAVEGAGGDAQGAGAIEEVLSGARAGEKFSFEELGREFAFGWSF